ncbi:MAG: hypothetical protein JO293_02600, partial [Candidatus Eremiobacteraeota bacterium]|nr:hypothetical protein [Candidatus Eremiobacteraeota bacterium]
MYRFSIVVILACVLLPSAVVADTTSAPPPADKTGQGAQAVPQTTLELPPGSDSARIPFKIVGSSIVVRVKVGYRDMDFAFDSGAGTTILNEDMFKQMVDTPGSTFALTTVKIGDVTLNDVTVYPSPILQRYEAADTAIVGLIGGDLMKNAVVRIDYDSDTIEVTKPSAFNPPANAVSVPMMANARVPIVSATIGNVTGDKFVIDTGAWSVVVFHQFAAEHPELFTKNNEFKGEGVRTKPICGTIVNTPYQESSVQVGDAASVPNWLVLLTPESSCFNRPLDGLIGYDYLRFFVVTIDMPRSRVYLELLKKYS